jgi:hypothetical protein
MEKKLLKMKHGDVIKINNTYSVKYIIEDGLGVWYLYQGNDWILESIRVELVMYEMKRLGLI